MPNQNLSSGQVLPGFYGLVDYNAQGSGNAPNNKCLIFGYVGASATRTPNQPFLPGGQNEADDGCERASDLANSYAAAVSQPEAQGAEIWLMPIVAPSGGTASVYNKIKVFVTSTNPSKPGTISMWINSQPVPPVGFTTADTATTIGAALAAAILTVKDLPLASATASSGVVTLTYKHKGTTGEDLPIRVNISPSGTGVQLSPGVLAFAINMANPGTVRVTTGATTVSTTLSGSETTSQVATKVAASFNADTYPLYAAVDGGSSSSVDLFYSNDKDVRRLSAAIVGGGALGGTVDLGSGATDGSGSTTSLTYNGTVGVGAPSLSAALTNLQAVDAFRSWTVPWDDATTMGVLATHIENQSNGSITGQKQQHLTVADFTAYTVEGALPAAVSPDLTATAPHYAFIWSPDVPIQAKDLAARIAAARASKFVDAPQFNWNGFQIKGNVRSPVLMSWKKPDPDSLNTALRTYGLAPIVKGPSGNLEVVKGRTTSLAPDHRLWAWSTEAQAAFHVLDLGQFFHDRFQGGSIVRFSDPKAPGIFDAISFVSATREKMRFWELNGNYDGADALAGFVKATPDISNPFRVNVEYPESPVLDLDQVVYTGHFTSPPQ